MEMKAFVAVVEAGSFVGGAQALALSNSVVSRLVADLERRLGVRLLQRTTRRLSLTREGEQFHLRCREVLASLEAAEAEAGAQAGQAIGLLRLNVPVSFGMHHLAPLWPQFMARHPQVTLEVTLADRVVDLVEEGYDLAVRIARLPNSSLVSRALTSTRLVLCASPEYLARHGTPQHPQDLAQHSVFAYTLLSTGEHWEFTGPEGPVSVRVQPRLRSNSGDTCTTAALAHQGLVMQPSFMVWPALCSGALVEVLPQYRGLTLGVHAVLPSRLQQTTRVRALVAFLVEAFQDAPWADPAGLAAASASMAATAGGTTTGA
ncbi:LysR family transcriptional regulator [Ideonella livida]|nr:LysR family transcriptional regulator [Ideonella livida]